MGCLFHLSPKFFNNVFVFVRLKTLGTLVNFDWLVNQVECSNVSTTEGVILCIIIRDVHEFICNCLIPLDPWL